MSEVVLALVYAAAGLIAFGAVFAAIPRLMPLFRRYALSRPNARSSHRTPTPQGGGLPIVLVAIVLGLGVGLTGAYDALPLASTRYYTLALLASLALALIGAADDMRPMPAATRLVMQAILVITLVVAAPAEWRILPDLIPLPIERALTVLCILWMVNLTNFMDGIDTLVVAEAAPVAGAVALAALAGFIDAKAGGIGAVLCGALLGFAPYNRHPARLFLGDVGSLPIGFLMAALLFPLAATQSFAAALLPVLYFVMDATGTLIAGLMAGQSVTQPHRRHAYQRAVDSGWPVPRVTRCILWLNALLVLLAGLCLFIKTPLIEAGALALGCIATGLVLCRFRAGGA